MQAGGPVDSRIFEVFTLKATATVLNMMMHLIFNVFFILQRRLQIYLT